mgnify:FL=1
MTTYCYEIRAFQLLWKGTNKLEWKVFILITFLVLFLGLSPSDEFDEAEANMIVDSTHDLRAKLIRIRFESDPDKKVMTCAKNSLIVERID